MAKVCCEPGCPHLATGKGRCDEHRRERQRREKATQREYDRERGSRHARGYDNRWAKAREQFLTLHPWCRRCQQHGARVRATVVDHITPHRGSRALFWRRSNWQPLCHSCHNAKTGADKRNARQRDQATRGPKA